MTDDFPLGGQVMAAGDEPAVGIPIHMIALVSYIDSDGDQAYKWHMEGAPNIQEAVGLLEMTKMRILADVYEWDGAE